MIAKSVPSYPKVASSWDEHCPSLSYGILSGPHVKSPCFENKSTRVSQYIQSYSLVHYRPSESTGNDRSQHRLRFLPPLPQGSRKPYLLMKFNPNSQVGVTPRSNGPFTSILSKRSTFRWQISGGRTRQDWQNIHL